MPRHLVPARCMFSFHCSPHPRELHSFPTRRSSDLITGLMEPQGLGYLPVRDELVVASGDGTVRFYRGADLSPTGDRKSTRLNSSHVEISYAVFCLKKKTGSPKEACASLAATAIASS